MYEQVTIGAWAITAPGCPVRIVMDETNPYATLVLGDAHREFEISLDADTLAEVVRRGTFALHTMGRQLPSPDEHAPTVETVVIRDPDGPTEVRVFIDGAEAPTSQFTVDAGAGWTWSDWTAAREKNLSIATPAVHAVLLDAYARPPGAEHITDVR